MSRKPKVRPGPFLKVVLQRHPMDCGVACLAMFLGLDYETVLVAMGSNPATTGATVKTILDTAAALKHPLQWTRKFDLEADTGILGVKSPEWATEHVVVLHEGMVVDTDGTLWDVDDYIKAHKARAVSLLVRVGG